jgi:hypothetical protein
VRFLAALLVLLGLVLPISKCTNQAGVTKEHYALQEALTPKRTSTSDDPIQIKTFELFCTLTAFLWPVAGAAAARRERSTWVTTGRLISEPLLIGGSAYWLQIVILFEAPASGYYSALAGYALYGLAWLQECLMRSVGLWNLKSDAA